MRRAGWIAVGIYILVVALGMVWFGSTCEGLACVGMAVLPALPAILLIAPFISEAADSYFIIFYAVSIILNLFISYWIGILASYIWRKLRDPAAEPRA